MCLHRIHAPRIAILLNGRCRLSAYPSSKSPQPNERLRIRTCHIYIDDLPLKHAQKKTKKHNNIEMSDT